MVKDTKPRFFYGYIIVTSAFFILAVSYGTLFSYGVFFGPIISEFGWSRALTSGAFSLGVVVYGFFNIITGNLSDKYGPRLVLTVTGFSLGLGYLLMSQVSEIWQLYLYYGVFIGVGMSGSWTPMVSLVARWFVKRRGLMTGITASGSGLGVLVIPPIIGQLIAIYDWRYVYILIGITVFMLFPLAAKFLKHDPKQIGLVPYGKDEIKGRGNDVTTSSLSFQEAFHTRQFWMVCIMYFCFSFSLHTIMVHIVPHAIGLGFSASLAASILAVIGWLNFVGRLIMGSLTDRIGVRWVLVLNLALLSVVLAWLLPARELWMFYLFAASFGFAYGSVAGMQSLIGAELFGLRSIGVILGCFTFSYTIGGAIGPLAAGYIFDKTSSYQLAFVISTVISIIGLIMALFLKPVNKSGITTQCSWLSATSS